MLFLWFCLHLVDSFCQKLSLPCARSYLTSIFRLSLPLPNFLHLFLFALTIVLLSSANLTYSALWNFCLWGDRKKLNRLSSWLFKLNVFTFCFLLYTSYSNLYILYIFFHISLLRYLRQKLVVYTDFILRHLDSLLPNSTSCQGQHRKGLFWRPLNDNSWIRDA